MHDHRATLARIARAEGLLAEDAFDAVQEAFRAFIVRDDARELVTRPDEARKVLIVLTRNLARNRRRLHAGARPHLSDASVVESLPDDAPTSEEVLESIEEREQLARCVGELGEVQRAVVTLRMLDEVPGEDVARMLDIAPGTRRGPLAPREGQPGHLHGRRPEPDLQRSHERKTIMSSNTIEITDANFEAEVAKSPLPVLIDFWAVWCGPCRAVAPHFESLAQEYAGRVRFGKCDVDVNQEIAARYDVRGVPMFLAFRDGKVVAQQLGAAPRAKLEELAKKALGAPAAATVPSAQASRAA